MALFDPNNSNFGQMAEGIPAAQKSFQDSLTAASLPQKLYNDALMQKINIMKAGNPTDFGLIQGLMQNQQQGLNQYLPGKSSEQPKTPGDAMNQQIIQMAAAGHPGAIALLSRHNQKASPQDIQQAARSGHIGSDDMTITHEGPSQKPKDIPDDLTQPSQSMSGDQMMMEPTPAPQAQATNLGDPMAMQKWASNIDPSKIMSTGTEDLAKSVLSSQAMMMRNVPQAQYGAQKAEVAAQQKETSDARKDATVRRGQDLKAGEYLPDNAPMSAEDASNAFHKIFKDFIGTNTADAAMKASLNPQGLAYAIDASPPQVKQMALANPTWAKFYQKYGGATPGQAPATGTPAAPGHSVNTPNTQAKVGGMISEARAMIINSGFPTSPNPQTGVPIPVIPLAQMAAIKAALIKKGIPAAQASQLMSEFLPGVK